MDDYVPENKTNALDYAIRMDDAVLLRKLLESGCSDQGALGEQNVLIASIKRASESCVEYLARSGKAVVRQADVKGWTALMHAANEGNVKILEMLSGRIDAHLTNDRGDTALIIACASGNARCALKLIESSVIDAQNNNKITALMIASERGETNCINMLVAHSDIELKDADGMDALMIAASEGQVGSSRILVDWHGKNPQIKTGIDSKGRNALMLAAEQGNEELTRILASSGLFEIKAVQEEGLNALMLAARMNKSQALSVLCEFTDPGLYALTAYGQQNALMVAAQYGAIDCVELLLKKDSVSSVEECERAKELAMSNGWGSCAKILMEHMEGIESRFELEEVTRHARGV